MKWLFLVFHMKLTCLAPHSHVVLLPNQRLVTQSISLPPWWSRCWDSKELLFSCSVVSDSLRPRGLQHARLPCPSPSLGVCPNSCPLSRWCHPTISSSVTLFFCPHSFPASGSFPVSQLFASVGQSIGASALASVLPMSIQDWSPLGLTGLIFLQSKDLWRVLRRVFSSTTIQNHHFFSAQPSLQSNFHICTWLLEKA